MWYEAHSHEYAILSSVMAFFKRLEAPISTGLLATDYVQNYTESYYLVDTYYRRICANYNKLENPSSEMEDLMRMVEAAYQSKFLDPLGKAFSDALKEQGNWDFPGLKMSRNFYQEVQAKNIKLQNFNISVAFRDALRYGIAAPASDHGLYE